MHTNLENYLAQYKNEIIYFHPNPGNAGDSLINVGCFDLFKKLGLKYKTFWWKDDFEPSGKTIVLGGGGGFVPEWTFTKDFVTKYHQECKKLILLPQTIVGNEELLSKLGSNVDIFVREVISYGHVKQHVSRCNLYLSDDVAFHININNALEERVNKYKFKSRVKDFLVDHGAKKKTGSHGILNAFRTDAEKSDIKLPEKNFDVSLPYSLGTRNEFMCRRTVNRFLNFLNQFDEVRTNRLHVAVGAMLLGKNVKFHANGYYKCKAVYEYSIKDKYSNLEWMD
jgi:exopolysaccharide biosynthesis predicted pyruvyltransferase EpsI